MKTKILTLFFFSLLSSLYLCAQTGNISYIELSEEQLKTIGFVINEDGIYFKTILPDEAYEDGAKEFIKEIGMYNGKEDFGTTMGGGYTKGNYLPNDSETLKSYTDITPLEVDYYLIRLADLNGKENFRFHLKNVKVLPVLIKQSKYNFKDKRDIIIYIKYTDQLKNKLNSINNIDDYAFDYLKVEE